MLEEKPQIFLRQLAAFALSRERKEKTIEKSWTITDEQIRSTEFAALRNFLTRNFALLLNMTEAAYLRGDSGASPVLTFEEGRRPGKLGKAYVVGLHRKTSRQPILNEAKEAADSHLFRQFADEIVRRFQTTDYWPKTYLFVVQFRIRKGAFDELFLSILTTQLQHGKFVADATKIVENLREAMVGDTVKKMMAYPIIGGNPEKPELLNRAKVYEEVSTPASYFYDFLNLEQPEDAQSLAENTYSTMRDTEAVTISSLIRDLPESAQDKAMVDIMIGGVTLRVSLRQLQEVVRLARFPRNRFFVVVEGERLSVTLGNHDLVYDLAVKVVTRDELLAQLKGTAP